MNNDWAASGQAVTITGGCAPAPLAERLATRKGELEKQLTAIEAVEDILTTNPDIERLLDLMLRAGV